MGYRFLWYRTVSRRVGGERRCGSEEESPIQGIMTTKGSIDNLKSGSGVEEGYKEYSFDEGKAQ